MQLKWPNDVYVDLPSTSPSIPGGEKKKVGGVLVNMSFADGNADVIIGVSYIHYMREHAPARVFYSKADVVCFVSGKGCGINVSTPAPVTALSCLSRPGERLEAETVLALALTEFEHLWTTFVSGGGSWAPLEEDYLDAWMHSCVSHPIALCLRSMSLMDPRRNCNVDSKHSDQLVTLTTVDPPVPVRIVGITRDYGLLRTIPERTGWGRSARHGADDEYIDLQPDGNSFDIMMGLIKAKK